MRISRKKRPDKPLIPRYSKNRDIAAPEVRVLTSDGENLGVMTTAEALQKAYEMEMDLVEINPKATPPVCQIIEYTQFKYQREKEARKQKANSHVSEIKGIRLSIRIGEHDLDIRRAQTEKFLNRGDKAKIEVILRGREHARTDLAIKVIRDFVADLEKDVPVRFEQEILRQGNKVTAVVTKR